MAEETHSIELSVGEAKIAVSGTKSFVEDKFYELYEEHGFSEMEVSNSTKSDTTEKQGDKEPKAEVGESEDISDYLKGSDISSQKDNALVVGWYLENVDGQDTFTKSEIESKALSEKVEVGKNLTRDLGNLADANYIHPAKKRDGEQAYWVKDEGEAYLREHGVIN